MGDGDGSAGGGDAGAVELQRPGVVLSEVVCEHHLHRRTRLAKRRGVKVRKHVHTEESRRLTGCACFGTVLRPTRIVSRPHNTRATGLKGDGTDTATTQLDNGVRMLTGQGHNSGGTIHLCHSTYAVGGSAPTAGHSPRSASRCSLLDVGPLTDYLQEVKSWLDSNPNDGAFRSPH